jgi:hypothetical protein
MPAQLSLGLELKIIVARTKLPFFDRHADWDGNSQPRSRCETALENA